MPLAAEEELKTTKSLAWSLVDKERLTDDRPITDAAVLQPLAAAAHLSLNSVTTKTEWEVKDKGDEAKFPVDFVTWVDGKLTAAAAAAGGAAIPAPVSGTHFVWC